MIQNKSVSINDAFYREKLTQQFAIPNTRYSQFPSSWRTCRVITNRTSRCSTPKTASGRPSSGRRSICPQPIFHRIRVSFVGENATPFSGLKCYNNLFIYSPRSDCHRKEKHPSPISASAMGEEGWFIMIDSETLS